MTSFIELAKKRFSTRAFSDKPVEQEKLDLIIEAGRVAPTACNNQPQKIYVIQSAEALEKLKKCTPCHFSAPLAFLICNDSTRSWTRPFDGKSSGDVDSSIVATHMMLAAADVGVGSTWVMFFDPAAVRTEFALAENLEPVALLPMGFPAEDAVPAGKHSEFRDDADMVEYV